MKILHADDHPMFREGLRFFLKLLGPDVAVVEASNLQAALDKLALEWPVDLMLLDLEMPGTSGVDGFLAIRRRHPALKVVVVSGVTDTRIIRTLLDAGARGYIPKGVSSEQLLAALRRVLDGEIYLPESLFIPAAQSAPGTAEDQALTARQLQLLPLIAEGLANKQIAHALGVTEGTVKQHLKELFRRLGTRNRTQAVAEARRLGLLRE